MVPEFTLPEVIKKEITHALETNQTGYVSSQVIFSVYLIFQG
jgi:hypothetical protein